VKVDLESISKVKLQNDCLFRNSFWAKIQLLSWPMVTLNPFLWVYQIVGHHVGITATYMSRKS